jgi:hypothetical protein
MATLERSGKERITIRQERPVFKQSHRRERTQFGYSIKFEIDGPLGS